MVLIIALGGKDERGTTPPPAPDAAAAAVDAAPIVVPPVDDAAAAEPVDAAAIATSTITIRTKPPGATVLIDGRGVGTAPVDVEIPTGDRPIVVEVFSGGRSARQEVVPDRDRTVTLTIRRPPGGDGLPF